MTTPAPFNGTWLTENRGKKPFRSKDAEMTDDAKLEQTPVNDSGTDAGSDARLTQRCSPDVPRDLLVKRNIAQQSKWLNDTTGDRSWAKHETQTVEWMMGRQVRTA